MLGNSVKPSRDACVVRAHKVHTRTRRPQCLPRPPGRLPLSLPITCGLVHTRRHAGTCAHTCMHTHAHTQPPVRTHLGLLGAPGQRVLHARTPGALQLQPGLRQLHGPCGTRGARRFTGLVRACTHAVCVRFCGRVGGRGREGGAVQVRTVSAAGARFCGGPFHR